MTVEASFIVPMAVCVIVLLIYFSFYMYDRCVLSQDVYILAFRAAKENASYKETAPEAYVGEHASEVAGRKYFGSSFPEFETTVTGADLMGKTVTVTGRAETNHSAMGRYFLKPTGDWDYLAAGRAKARNYPKHIRMFTRLRDIGKEITGLGEW